MWCLLCKNYNFRKYWIANTISSIGDYIDDIAFAQLVYLVTDSTLLTSYVFAIKVVLSFLSIFTATYIDRKKKRNILIITSVGQASVLIILVGLYSANLLNTVIIVMFATLQSVFSTFSVPAQNSILPSIVTNDELISARSSFNVSSQLIQVFGYIFSGIIITYIGLIGALVVDILTFGIAAFIISTVKISEVERAKFESRSEFWSDVKCGFRFVIGNRGILVIIIATLWGNMFTAPVQSLMPAYFSQSEHTDSVYSLFMICTAIGGIMGSWALNRLNPKMSKTRLFEFGFIIGAVGMVFLFIDKGIIPFCAAMAIGISFGVVSIMNATMIQIETPRNMLARVFSIFRFISYFAGPLGMVLAGALGEYILMRHIMLTFGLILIITTILTMRCYPKEISEE